MKFKHSKLIVTSFSLLLCLGFSFVANKASFQTARNSKVEASSRNPASQIFAQIRSGSLNIERQFAVKLAQVKARGIASIGRPADALENLRFGVLEGKYSLKMEGDKIADINFIDNPESEGNPATIKDRFEFLKQYGTLIDAISKPSRVGVDVRGTKVIETYRVKTNSPETDVVVSFVLDDLDRLIALHAEKTSALTIF